MNRPFTATATRPHRSAALLCAVILAIASPALSQASAAGTVPEAQAAVSVADSLFALGEWDEAIRRYEPIVRDNPEDTESAYRLGICYHSTGDYESAIRTLRVAAESASRPM